ncbi:MAG: hypothetical protein A3G34_13230 [Candidatus Lindowbacteria bacterium RIFCSPLOWO2_12_FULL_62_27]|nr:MAG: hypothetical protein A3G34_13230 [Candidatus Lindowbacteria bacterium RIFCSPLOWO2_12_FULL_62_27]
MKKLSNTETREAWRVVRRDFPDDEMMQEIHFVRILHRRQTRRLSQRERIRFYQRAKQGRVQKHSIAGL